MNVPVLPTPALRGGTERYKREGREKEGGREGEREGGRKRRSEGGREGGLLPAMDYYRSMH